MNHDHEHIHLHHGGVSGNNTTADGGHGCLRGKYYGKVMISLFLITAILSVILNVLLWLAFAKKKRLRTVAITYVISLSVSDFITAASMGWLEVYYVWKYPFVPFGRIGSDIVNSFWCLSLVTPFVHVLLITVDRFLAVKSPTLYSDRKSWKRELFKISLMWIYCIGVTALLACHFLPVAGDGYEWNISPLWYYPFLAIHMGLPMIICSALYVNMLRHVNMHSRTIRRYHEHETSSMYEFKFAKTVATVIFFLYIIWIPVIAMEAVYAMLAHTCVIDQLGTVSVWLTCTSGVIDPIIYLCKSPRVRHVVINEIICCRPAPVRKFTRSSTRRIEIKNDNRASAPVTCDRSTNTSDYSSHGSRDRATQVSGLEKRISYSRMTVSSEMDLEIGEEYQFDKIGEKSWDKSQETSFSS